MEHMILWAICTVIVMLTFFGMHPMDVQLGLIKPDKITNDVKYMDDGKRSSKMIFGSILAASPIWGFFELVY
jgi:hypothetical protein